MKYVLGDLAIDTGPQVVSRGGAVLALPKLSYDLLLVLLRAAPNVVSIDQMMREVWPGIVVSPETVSKRVTLLRDALGDDAKAPRYIAGLRGRGYQVVAHVAEVSGAATGSPEPLRESQPVDEPRGDGTDQIAGSVPPPTKGLSPEPRVRGLRLALGLALLAGLAMVAWLNLPRVPRSLPSTTSAKTHSPPTIAVLPFADMSENKDQEYFADGMAEETLDRLAQIPGLTVIGRTSSFQFKGRNADLRGIGAALGAEYVVEGSVRKSGERLRITAQLISATDGTHVWSQTFDQPVGDVLKIQEQVAFEIARALQIGVGADDIAPQPPLRSAEAYKRYLMGRYAGARSDKEGFEQAAAYFREALELDPSFSRASSWLSAVYMAQAEWEYVPPAEGYAKAREATQRALQLDPADARLYGQLGDICTSYDWKWQTCEQYIRQARALAPHDPHVLRYAANLEAAQGRWEDARRDIQSSLTVDPLNSISYEVLAELDYRAGRLTEAQSTVRKLLEISPNYGWGHYYLGCILLAQGQPLTARSAFEQEDPDEARVVGMALADAALGRKKEVRNALESVIKNHGGDQAYEIAEVYALDGNPDQALQWLKRAYTQKDGEMYRIKGNPMFKGIENDPRYQSLMRDMNFDH
jgi:TolB-like protein/DNA-binding winged helix-turn-helix (wHTH) protein